MAQTLQSASPARAEIFCSWDHHAPGASARGTLPEWVLGMTISGRVLYNVDRDPIESKRGDCVLVRALHPQFWRVPAGSKWNVIYAVFTPRPHWYPWLQSAADQPLTVLRLPPDVRRRVFRGLRRALLFTRSARPNRYEFAMHALEGVILRCWEERMARGSPALLDPRVRQAIELLGSSTDPVRLEQLARKCFLSRSHLAHLFRKQVGVTPLQYQERKRIEDAQRMLRLSIDSVGTIAYACGFEDSRYFSTRFKRQTGFTPRDYRRRSLKT